MNARLCVSCLLLALAFGACAPRVAVPDPDLSAMEAPVAQALAEARAKVVGQPSSAEGWGELAAAYDAHLLNDLAQLCYRRAVELEPTDFRWNYLLAIVREIDGADADEIQAAFGEAAALRSDYAPLHVRLGDGLWRRREFEAAQVSLRRALELAPETAMAHRRLGQLLLAQGDTAKAAEALARAATLEPRDRTAYVALAQALEIQGLSQQAAAIRMRAEGLEPVTALDDPVYEDEVAARNQSTSGLFADGTASVRGGDYAQGVARLQRVVERQPEHASARLWLGVGQRGLGRTAEAEEQLRRAAELEPSMVQAQIQLAGVLMEQARFGEAVQRMERAEQLMPLSADGEYGLGRALRELGREAAARDRFERALRLQPDHVGAATALQRRP